MYGIYANIKGVYWWSFSGSMFIYQRVILFLYIYNTGWWFQSLWQIWKSIGRMTSHIFWKIKNVWNHQPVYIYIWKIRIVSGVVPVNLRCWDVTIPLLGLWLNTFDHWRWECKLQELLKFCQIVQKCHSSCSHVVFFLPTWQRWRNGEEMSDSQSNCRWTWVYYILSITYNI